MRVTKNSRGLCSLLVAVAALGVTAARAQAADAADATPAHASTPAERQARGETAARAFMMGRYDDALATYLDLYIQSDGRPEYLRNIGRCQQKLRQYARAIDSFKEYLRRSKKLGADEKKEVQGFISEMETALASENAAGTAPAPAPAPATPPRPAPAAAPAPLPAPAPPLSTPQASPAPTYPPAPSGSYPPPYGAKSPALAAPPTAPNPYASAPPSHVITRAPGPEPASAGSSPLKPIGIVTVVVAGAAAIGGTIALVRSKSIYDDASNAGCRTGQAGTVFCNGKADSVQSSNTLSKILYVGAGVLGIAGVAMIVIAPSPAPDGRVGLSVTGRF